MNLALIAGIGIVLVLLACVFAVGVYTVGLRWTLLSIGATVVILVLVKIAQGLILYGLQQ